MAEAAAVQEEIAEAFVASVEFTETINFQPVFDSELEPIHVQLDPSQTFSKKL